MNRKLFLTGAGASAVAIPAAASATTRRNPWNLWIQRLDNGETVNVPVSLTGHTLFVPGYNAVCYALRDAHVAPSIGVRQISVATLEVLCATQQAFFDVGAAAPIVMHSGYRSPETNARTEGAARGSLHMQGMAVDFHVPGISMPMLYSVVRQCSGIGGIGYYERGDGGWLHIDTGWRREWAA